jgi:hypothetical protein
MNDVRERERERDGDSGNRLAVAGGDYVLLTSDFVWKFQAFNKIGIRVSLMMAVDDCNPSHFVFPFHNRSYNRCLSCQVLTHNAVIPISCRLNTK